MEIKKVTDEAFKKYGKIVEGTCKEMYEKI